MGGQQNQSSPVERADNPVSPSVVDDFRINNHHYLVICFRNSSENFTKHLTPFLHLLWSLEIGKFEVDGQLCAIVEVNNSLPDTNQNIIDILTARELEIIKLVALGRANKQIASQLHISEWTVSTHLRRIFAKLGVDSRAAMVCRCASLLSF
ncbi:MAG: response regulator transcription factor [Fischerella sp.]|nr:response regulator transcription factor [Fischerella sp.]